MSTFIVLGRFTKEEKKNYHDKVPLNAPNINTTEISMAI